MSSSLANLALRWARQSQRYCKELRLETATVGLIVELPAGKGEKISDEPDTRGKRQTVEVAIEESCKGGEEILGGTIDAPASRLEGRDTG